MKLNVAYIGLVLGVLLAARGEAIVEKIKIFDPQLNKVVLVDRVVKSDAEWKKVLTPEQYEVTTNQGTEKPFTCTFAELKENGFYQCLRCCTDLFRTSTKFESGTGWPSFYAPISPLNIIERADKSLGMIRTEVLCARCGSHLGHVFDDGPPPTHKRYCLNGIALLFVPLEGPGRLEEATFGGGCFWHVEESFRKIRGVCSTSVGYAGGTVPEPSYEMVCRGDTGHAEVVNIKFDPKVISYDKLLDVFWDLRDPTTIDRQGPDVGSQYRSVIFYYSEKQKTTAEKSKERLARSGKYKAPIVTRIVPAGKFYPAEEYHQRYLEKQGRSVF